MVEDRKFSAFITRMKKLGIDPKTVYERNGAGTDTPDSSDSSTVRTHYPT